MHRLTWHEGKIPADEIWVKLGGDKGGGSFKMVFQICNVEHPNSPVNRIAAVDALKHITLLLINLW